MFYESRRMNNCPLCRGEGKLPDRQVHFGDGEYEPKTCSLCRGTGEVEIEPVRANKIIITKSHGIWGDSRSV